MQIDNNLAHAEAYNDICRVYESLVVSHHKHAQTVLDRLTSTFLKPCSHVLDVGCGTGQPITKHFAENKHDVTAIDYSTGMLNTARAAVPNATFLQVEMTSWEPSDGKQYDLVIASHCLYTLSVAQIKAMLYKFSHWVKKDGIVVIGMSYNQTNLDRVGVQFDQRGWAEGFTDTFLGHDFSDSTYGREEAWVNLMRSTGLEVVDIDRVACMRTNRSDPDVQFYIIARRVQDNPCIGPFPFPDAIARPVTIQHEEWRKLIERQNTEKVDKAVFEALCREPRCHKVLRVANLDVIQQPHLGIELQQISELPSADVQPGSFDGVILNWILHLISSPGDYIDHAIKAISPTGNAKVIVVQAAPDNELVSLINEASQGLNLPVQHHGMLLNEAETKCKAAGFQNIEYIRTEGSIDTFCSFQGDERIELAASLLSRVYIADEGLREQVEERLKKLLKTHFLFRSSGGITCQTIIFVAERK